MRDGAARGGRPLARRPGVPALRRAVGAAAAGGRADLPARGGPRGVRAPRPRVDSALVALRRVAPARPQRCGRWCGRRSRRAARPWSTRSAGPARTARGSSPRSPRVGPAARRPARGGPARTRSPPSPRSSRGPADPRRPGQDQPAPARGPARPDGYHPLRSLMVALDGLADRSRSSPRRTARRRAPASTGPPTSPGAALDALEAEAGPAAAAAGGDRQGDPRAGRPGRRVERRRRGPGRRQPPARAWASAPRELERVAARVGLRRGLLRPRGRPVGRGPGRAPAPGRAPRFAALLANARRRLSTAAVYARFDRRPAAAAPGAEECRPAMPALGGVGCATTSGRPRAPWRPGSARARGALRGRRAPAVLLCGSGACLAGVFPDRAAAEAAPRAGSTRPASGPSRRPQRGADRAIRPDPPVPGSSARSVRCYPGSPHFASDRLGALPALNAIDSGGFDPG